MSLVTLGDALQFQRLRQDGYALKTDLQRLTQELSTGRHADLGRALGGNFNMLSDLNRQLKLTESFSDAIAQAGIDANLRQLALEKVETEVSGYGPEIMAFSTSGSTSDFLLTIGNADSRLTEAINALNGRAGGKSLFSGDAPNQNALISGEEMLTALKPLVDGAPDAASAMAAIDDWFNAPGGGYETVAWTGGTGAASPVVLSEGVQTEVGVSALDPAIREVLSGLAMAALAAETGGTLDDASRRELAFGGAMRMISGEGQLIVVRSDLGAAQARIESARVEVEAARSSLEIERSRLTDVDAYEVATDLQTVQTRLESLYILTARLSQLSLSEYIR